MEAYHNSELYAQFINESNLRVRPKYLKKEKRRIFREMFLKHALATLPWEVLEKYQHMLGVSKHHSGEKWPSETCVSNVTITFKKPFKNSEYLGIFLSNLTPVQVLNYFKKIGYKPSSFIAQILQFRFKDIIVTHHLYFYRLLLENAHLVAGLWARKVREDAVGEAQSLIFWTEDSWDRMNDIRFR